MNISTDPVYFLIRNKPTCFTAYARGISILDIPNLDSVRIMRFYPVETDLTHRLIELQRHWRQRRQLRIWCSHPRRLFFREQFGKFPLVNTI
jgi:hypothetical protein